MHLFLDKNLAANYQSPSQVARVLTKPLPSKRVGCWQLCNMKKTNEKSDVEISYLFRFDTIEHSNYIEIFHNGMDEAFIQNNILNVIQSHLPNVHYYFD